MPQQWPVSALAKDAQLYPSRTEAALAAVNTARGGDRHVEVGGGILFNPQTRQYAYTTPAGMSQDAHFGTRVQFVQPWQLDSIYHSHPSAPRSTQFSQDDIDIAQRLGVPSYILTRYDNKVRLFDPATSPVVKSPEGNFSPGTVVDETTQAAASKLTQALLTPAPAPDKGSQ